MKKILIILGLTMGLLFSFNTSTQGQPEPPGEHSENGNQENGGDAPIGSGLFILLGMSGVYGFTKTRFLKKSSL